MTTRQLEPSGGIDPENAAALGLAPRSRVSTREDDVRGKRRRAKDENEFHVPKEAIPKGWCVEWKRVEILGQPDPKGSYYRQKYAEAGWKPADPAQFPMLVTEGTNEKTIDRGGMRLYIRPAHMKKTDLKLDLEEAKSQVRDKLTEIGMTGDGEMPRKVTAFNRDWDRPAGRMIPDDNGEIEE